MPLCLDLAADEDMPRFCDIIFDSLGDTDEFVRAVWPAHWTAAGRQTHTQTFLAKKTQPPQHSTFLKVTDTATGAMVGAAAWAIYGADGTQKPPERVLAARGGSADEREYAGFLLREYMARRMKFIREATTPMMTLEFAGVDPAHQRRGAGTMLVRWGTEIADRMGAAVTVESTAAAKHLYEQNGFVVLEDVEIELPEKWAHRPRTRVVFMVRPSNRT